MQCPTCTKEFHVQPDNSQYYFSLNKMKTQNSRVVLVLLFNFVLLVAISL